MRRRLLQATTLTLLIVLGLGALGSDVSRADDGPYPGLPGRTAPPGLTPLSWGGSGYGAIVNVKRARQWSRPPLMVNAFQTYGGQAAPGDLPERCVRASVLGANIYFVAEPGAERNYGQTPGIKVRTVAFGSIPVEATVRLEQRRDAGGLPLPITIESLGCTRKDGMLEAITAPIRSQVYTRIVALAVDGVDFDLHSTCRTRTPGDLRLEGKGYAYGWDNKGTPDRSDDVYIAQPAAPLWESGYFNLSPGGLLTGTMDVPDFTGCSTSNGDDVSRLVTAAVSGTGYPMRVFQGSAFGCSTGPGLPPAPGGSSPFSEESGCRIQFPNQVPDAPPEIPDHLAP